MSTRQFMQLAGLMANVNGSTFVSIDTETAPDLRGGRHNPFRGRTVKRMVAGSVIVFQNKRSNGYENMVKRRLVAEGKNPKHFKLSERAWGTRMKDYPFVEYEGRYYLEVIFLRCGMIQYLVDGVPTDPRRITGLVLDKPEGDQGGLDDKVIIRTFACQNIRAITINKQHHVLLSQDEVFA